MKSRVRLKAIVQSILHAHLVPRCPHLDIFGGKGRAWVQAQELPPDEHAAIARHIEDYDRQTASQKLVEQDIARAAMSDDDVKRLMTIPGVDMVVAVGVMAAIGHVDRFASADQLSAYLGLNPSVRQSGDGPAYHGRITKRGRSDARHLLVEAAWQTVRSPGPLRDFYDRVKARRGAHVGAVAVARKLAVLVWHMLPKAKIMPGVARPCLRARCASSSSRQVWHRVVVSAAVPTLTISLNSAKRTGLAPNTPSWPIDASCNIGASELGTTQHWSPRGLTDRKSVQMQKGAIRLHPSAADNAE